jgi:small subunit ribosomal protein S16
MLTLRFQRVGKTHDTTFRIVAVDSRFSSKSGKVKEVLGWWDPRQDKFELKKDRIDYWLKNGAQSSDSCFNLLIKAKIIKGKKRPVVIHKKKAKEGETQIKAEAPKIEKVQSNLPAQAGEVPAELTSEVPKVKEKIKEEPKEKSKPEETLSSAKATEGREKSEEKSEEKEKKEKKQEEKEESKKEKSEEKPEEQKEEIKEDADSK